MDADRYQRIQNLFWKAEELPPERWESFLKESAGDDLDLMDEVRSLLREHDPKAAQVEGDSVRRSTELRELASSGASSGLEKVVRPEGPLPEPNRKVEQTLVSAQRTHAMPRLVEQRPKPTSKPSNPTPSNSKPGQLTSQTLTSIGPKMRHWGRCQAWLTIAIPMILAVWIAAAFAGQSDGSRQMIERSSRIFSIVENIGDRVTDLLEDQHQTAIWIGQSQEIRQAVKELTAAPIDSRLEHSKRLRSLLIQQQEGEGGSELNKPGIGQYALWDQTLTLIDVQPPFASANPTLIGTRVEPEGAAALTRALDGRVQLLGPTIPENIFGKEIGTTQQPIVGWMVPIADSDEPGSNTAVLLLSQQDLFDKINRTVLSIAQHHQVDAYLVNREGIMLTHSTQATAYFDGPVSGRFRVAEPIAKDTHYSIAPLTVSAASVQISRRTQVPEEVLLNYAGRPTHAGWLWLEPYSVGVIVELQAAGSNGLMAWVEPWRSSWPWALILSAVIAGIAGLASWKLISSEAASNQRRQPLGHYQIREVLGTGGMGEVYRAHHMELGRDIAIKILRRDRQDDDDRQRFDREARMAATLTSPHSVTIYDYGRDTNGDTFCAMQLLEGLTLYEIVARSGPQPTGRVVWILRQICQSIHEAHSAGLMHRDLKPQNVMLSFDSLVGDWAVVFDFGLAKPLQPDPNVFQTAETIWAGTPMYMSPERFREPSVMDPRSDIYSIGCIAYFLLAGHPPFSECDPQSMFALILSESPVSLSLHRGGPVEPEIESLVSRCMAKDKETRYASISSLMDDLDELTRHCPWSRQQARSWWQTHASELL